MTLQDEVVSLRDEVGHLQSIIVDLRGELTVALARLAELEQQQKPPTAKSPPSFVKPNRPKRETADGKRKKRAAQHNTSRRRETPTRIERHALDRCPVCDYLLTGESIDYTREVIEVPPPPPVEITEHRVIKRMTRSTASSSACVPIARPGAARRSIFASRSSGKGGLVCALPASSHICVRPCA